MLQHLSEYLSTVRLWNKEDGAHCDEGSCISGPNQGYDIEDTEVPECYRNIQTKLSRSLLWIQAIPVNHETELNGDIIAHEQVTWGWMKTSIQGLPITIICQFMNDKWSGFVACFKCPKHKDIQLL